MVAGEHLRVVVRGAHLGERPVRTSWPPMTSGISMGVAASSFSLACSAARSGVPGAWVRVGSLRGAGMRKLPLDMRASSGRVAAGRYSRRFAGQTPDGGPGGKSAAGLARAGAPRYSCSLRPPPLASRPCPRRSPPRAPAVAPPGAPPPAPTPAFLRRFFRRDRFAAGAGIRLVECGPGRAVARMRLRDGHLNGVDVVQGGAVFTLADFAFAVACNSHGPVALAIEVSVSFLAATTRGTLTATAVEVSRSSRLSRVEVEVRDATGVPVALFHGTAYVTRDSIHEVAVGAGPRLRRRARPGGRARADRPASPRPTAPGKRGPGAALRRAQPGVHSPLSLAHCLSASAATPPLALTPWPGKPV